MQQKKDQYVAPELVLIGDATNVIRGLGALGFDFRGEIIEQHMEYEYDQPAVN